jgi:hypothetical protein
MINWHLLEDNLESLKLAYLSAQPFPHLVLTDFCDEEKLSKLYASIPELS